MENFEERLWIPEITQSSQALLSGGIIDMIHFGNTRITDCNQYPERSDECV